MLCVSDVQMHLFICTLKEIDGCFPHESKHIIYTCITETHSQFPGSTKVEVPTTLHHFVSYCCNKGELLQSA